VYFDSINGFGRHDFGISIATHQCNNHAAHDAKPDDQLIHTLRMPHALPVRVARLSRQRFARTSSLHSDTT